MNEEKPIVVLTIAGSDTSGRSGVQADIKTMSVLGCFVTNAITGVVTKNGVEGFSIFEFEGENIKAQLRANFEDFEIKWVKIGALFDAETIDVVAEFLREKEIKNLIIDPVMVAKNGAQLMSQETLEIYKTQLLPLAFILTPNLLEAQMLIGKKLNSKEEIKKACFEIVAQGSEFVIIKGGRSQEKDALDLVCSKKGEIFEFSYPRISRDSLHGSGCTFSAALTAFLAKDFEIKDAIRMAKDFVYNAILQAKKLERGTAPLNHFFILETTNRKPKKFFSSGKRLTYN